MSAWRPVTRGEKPLENFSLPLEKCVGHNLKILDIFQKIWASFGKLITLTGVPSRLRACLQYACLITMQSSIVSNKSICALNRAPAIFHVQFKFKAATYCHASLSMWVSPSRWWITNWQVPQIWVWYDYCLCTSILPYHVNNEVNKCNPEKSVSLWGSKSYAYS